MRFLLALFLSLSAHAQISPGSVDANIVGGSVTVVPSGTQAVSGTLTCNAGTGTQAVSLASQPLPTGASTETTLAAVNTKLPSGLTVSATRLLTDGSGVTQPVSGTLTCNAGTGTLAVSAASLPLPTGAATEASITNGNQIAQVRGTYNTTAPTLTNGTNSNLQLDVNGNLKIASFNNNGASAVVLSSTGDFFLQTGMLKYSGVTFEVSGTWAGTIEAAVSSDGGSTYHTIPVVPVNLITGTTQTSVTSNGLYYFPISGDAVKISMTAFTSGSATVRTAYTTNAQNPSQNVLLAQIAQNTGAQATDTIQSGTITALNGNVAVSAQGGYTVTARVSGTWVGTLVAEGLMADGTTWQQLPLYTVGTTLPYPQSLTTTANGSFAITGGGYTQIRIRASAFTSGTVNVALNASLAQQTVFSAQLGVWTLTQPGPRSYAASVLAFTPAATPTDVFTITGAANTLTRIRRLSFDCTQTTTGSINIQIIKRSTANTAGTAVTDTAVPFDSTNAAATSVVRHYTANPTLGTLVGVFHSEKLFVPAPAEDSEGDELRMDYVSYTGIQLPTLRSASEVLAINMNGATLAGGSCSATIRWTEE